MESDDELAPKNFGGGQAVKWKSMEHRGVQFAPAYVPHGVPLLYKGKTFNLCAESEEVCNFWARENETEFGEKDTVRKNFLIAFTAVMKKYHRG